MKTSADPKRHRINARLAARDYALLLGFMERTGKTVTQVLTMAIRLLAAHLAAQGEGELLVNVADGDEPVVHHPQPPPQETKPARVTRVIWIGLKNDETRTPPT